MSDLLMKDLIPKKHKHLLYKDESPELCDFLILKYAEVYRYTENALRLLIFSSSKASQLKKSGLIYDVWSLDDIILATAKNSNLDAIISMGATKRRIDKKGNNLKKLEIRLGHKIFPFNPLIL